MKHCFIQCLIVCGFLGDSIPGCNEQKDLESSPIPGIGNIRYPTWCKVWFWLDENLWNRKKKYLKPKLYSYFCFLEVGRWWPSTVYITEEANLVISCSFYRDWCGKEKGWNSKEIVYHLPDTLRFLGIQMKADSNIPRYNNVEELSGSCQGEQRGEQGGLRNSVGCQSLSLILSCLCFCYMNICWVP